MESQSEARQRLAALMDKRRLDLRLTWQDVAAAGDVSLRALANARTADSEIRPLTRRGIEKGLRWETGTVDRVLAGGEPAGLSADPVPAPVMEFTEEDLPDDEYSPEERAALQDYADEFKLRLARARRRYPGERLTGQMVFPRDALYQAMWDALSSLGWPIESLPRSMAAAMVDRPRESGGESGTAAGLGVRPAVWAIR